MGWNGFGRYVCLSIDVPRKGQWSDKPLNNVWDPLIAGYFRLFFFVVVFFGYVVMICRGWHCLQVEGALVSRGRREGPNLFHVSGCHLMKQEGSPMSSLRHAGATGPLLVQFIGYNNELFGRFSSVVFVCNWSQSLEHAGGLFVLTRWYFAVCREWASLRFRCISVCSVFFFESG